MIAPFGISPMLGAYPAWLGRDTRRELFRFGVIGIVATVTHIAVALLLIGGLALPVLRANALAFSIALLVSYFGNHRWTFRRSGQHERHFPRFLATALSGFALNQLIVFLTVEIAGWHYLAGISLVVLIVPALNFVLSKRWTFTRRVHKRSQANETSSDRSARRSRYPASSS